MARPPILDMTLLCLAALVMATALFLGLRQPGPRYPLTTAALTTALDSDGDGSLSRDEYEALTAGSGAFLLLDQDGDQRLDEQEIELLLLTVNPDFHREQLDDQ